MKRKFLLRLIGVGTLALISQFFSGGNVARAQQTYPLVCRGGGSLVIGLAPGERNIGFVFTRATRPAGAGLAPGECSWVDRGLSSAEPDRLSQHVPDSSTSLKEGGALAPENRWFEELHSADKYWTFQVYNNGRGQLIATSARPNAGISVSPTARMPPEISEIKRADLPKARTQVDETPRIVLRNPTGRDSLADLLKGLPDDPSINAQPAPRAMSMDEKVSLLRVPGQLETFDEKPTPYVTLTPQQPSVAGKGYLVFVHPVFVYSQGDDNIDRAVWVKQTTHSLAEDFTYPPHLRAVLNFETKGLYLMTFTVWASADGVIKFTVAGAMPEQTFLSKEPYKWQYLNTIVEVEKPGEYMFSLKANGYWRFHSCEVTAWKK